MIRVICTEVEVGRAVHVGGPANVAHKTFDIEGTELEAWLTAPPGSAYNERFVVGIEVIKTGQKP